MWVSYKCCGIEQQLRVIWELILEVIKMGIDLILDKKVNLSSLYQLRILYHSDMDVDSDNNIWTTSIHRRKSIIVLDDLLNKIPLTYETLDYLEEIRTIHFTPLEICISSDSNLFSYKIQELKRTLLQEDDFTKFITISGETFKERLVEPTCQSFFPYIKRVKYAFGNLHILCRNSGGTGKLFKIENKEKYEILDEVKEIDINRNNLYAFRHLSHLGKWYFELIKIDSKNKQESVILDEKFSYCHFHDTFTVDDRGRIYMCNSRNRNVGDQINVFTKEGNKFDEIDVDMYDIQCIQFDKKERLIVIGNVDEPYENHSRRCELRRYFLKENNKIIKKTAPTRIIQQSLDSLWYS